MKKTLFTLMLLLCCMTAAWAQDDGFINVDTTEKLWNAIKANDHAKVRITADFALSDINKDYELYCDTFYGTIDGNGHTIKGDPKADVRARTYMFANCDGATIKNLTFKGIRVNSDKNSNQAIITSKAQNGCVFENITFENVHTWTNYDNAAAAAGWARDCTFTNITVKNSDFTTDEHQAGTVVAHAIRCSFENIKIENCKTFSGAEEVGIADKSGGVVARADYCTFINCFVDSKSGVFSDYKNCGGIVGYAVGCNIKKCTNCAIVAAGYDNLLSHSVNENCVGGIVGSVEVEDDDAETITTIDSCINAGIMFNASYENFESIAKKYKQSDYSPSTVTFADTTYIIQELDQNTIIDKLYTDGAFGGGIVGYGIDCRIKNCTNLSPMYLNYNAGAIAGYLEKSSIECCANYGNRITTPNAKQYRTGAILGACSVDISIINCLNVGVGDNYDCLVGSVFAGNCRVKNCLNTIGDSIVFDYPTSFTEYKIIDDNNYDKNSATPEKLASGEMCVNLGAAWQQNLGTDSYPTPTGSKGLYHRRKVKGKDYGTICLPYPLTSHETLYGKKEREYYIFKEATNEADETVSLRFEYADEVPAGTPAIFRAHVNSDYDFEASTKDYDFELKPTGCSDWTFNGTYEQKVFEGNDAKNIYYLDGTYTKSAIKNAQKTTIAPYRAYFSGPSIETLTAAGAKSIRFVIEDEDGETTALESVGCDLVPVQNNGKTYSIMGTEVNNNYRGIVISNGKKILRK